MKGFFLALLCLTGTAQAADMSSVRFVIDAKGIVHGTGYVGHSTKSLMRTYKIDPQDDLPKAFDLRTKGFVSPIKNQGQCGSCWAHATVESLEDAILRSGTPGLELSAQDMTSCNSQEYGCRGGEMQSADFLVSPGIALEKDFPYYGRDVRCPDGLKIAAKATSWTFVGAEGRAPTTTELKAAIVAHGSLFVTVAAGGSDWNGQTTMIDCSASGINHMVEIVGWTEADQWIMRNSWGTDWGDKGFAYMPFGCDEIASDVDSAAYTVL